MPQLYLNPDYTDKQKKLLKAAFPKEYAELYPEVKEEVKEPQSSSPETKKEEESAAE